MATSSQALRPCYRDLPRFVLDHGLDEDKPILIDAAAPERAITKAQAKVMVENTAQGLQAVGLKRGDTVCVVHLNDIMYPVVFLAIIMAGGVFSGANPMYKAGELRHHFEVSETKFVFSDPASLAAVSEASEGLFDAGNIIVWGDEEAGASVGARYSLAGFLAGLAGAPALDPVSFDDETRARDTVAVLMSTSGTTGLPKMAARSHLSLVTENLAIQDGLAKNYEVARLLFTPFFHGFTAPLALVDALVHGRTTYVMPRFNVDNCLEYVERYNITEIAAPPPVLLAFRRVPEAKRTALCSFRLIWSGGAPMAAKMQNEAVTMFYKHARIVQVYGMTEAGWITTFKYPEMDETGSVGRILPSYEAMIVSDKDGTDITTTQQEGMLFVKGPITMLHYHNNTPETLTTLRNSWLRTGDMAYFSHDRKLFITDRLKDMIKYRGWQISPTEIEACLLSHAAVADAGVFGFYSSDVDQEAPVAHVVLKTGVPLYHEQFGIMEELMEYCRDKLAKYKTVALQIRFKDAIPKNPAGKILRNVMRLEELNWRDVREWMLKCRDWNAGPPEEEEIIWEEDEDGVWVDEGIGEGPYVNEETEKDKAENEILARRLDILGL
ncbi:acetyl-CoA synthetase-like protein [Aureobasidium sp. EXF-10727]|nr:acetyl-CoA synthetase-like protein [Aureobasidium sp. EXF-10727]